MYIVVHTLWFNVENVCLLFKCVFCREIKPSDSRLAAIFSLGEWHNYHHVFPGDYRIAELGSPRMSATVVVIDLFAWLGLIYDLKTSTEGIVRSRALRTGDGSHSYALENTSITADDRKDHVQ
jgi:stearoyl-CoA desaturase (delta-9 desaturase)